MTLRNLPPILIGLLGLVVVVAGCGGRGLVDVKGVVNVNEKPVEGATVLFFPTNDPEGVTAAGTTNSLGEYSLSSGLDQGVATGEYVVTVVWPDPSVKPSQAQIMMGQVEPGPDLLKGKYSNKQKSELRVTIDSSTTEIPPFSLERPKK